MSQSEQASSNPSQQARTNILKRLKQARVTPINTHQLDYSPWGTVNKPDQKQKTDRFIANMTASHAEIKHIELADLDAIIESIVKSKGLKSAAIGTGGKYQTYIANGLQNLDVTYFEKPLEGWKTELFEQIDVGITHTLAGIADTGALVLWPTIEEPRTLSLVPPCHIAIIEESTIMSNFIEVIESQNWTASMPTNALLISGPSKTADIQQTLAYGAHGPSELVVIILK